ncbi:ABC transporter permease [Paenibacillus tengchongensis]|uniref:ABC transporter permease n=1 Tax=Paenibacillus tengchongensis TaxID=2608684 RepID=UPI00124EB7E8|nr:ABC-2 family transporter protein [Paenibacillus tengchongensis]
MISEVKIYGKYLRMHLLSGMEYKGWWLMLIQVFVVVVTDPISTVLLFSRFGNIGEWTVAHIILVYALAVASFGLAESLCRGFDYFPWQLLRTGEFDRLLLRPRSLFVQVAASRFHLHRLVRPATGICAVVWALSELEVPLSPRNIAILVMALAGGCIMYCGVFVLTSGVAFFTVKGLDWIYLFTNASYQVTRCPEPYLPQALKSMFSFLLPMLFISFYPAATVCGWDYPAWPGYLALPAGAAFLGCALLVWRIGVRHYKSTGS